MKRIFSYVLAGLALMTMFSCEEKIDNDEYSDWLGQHYNQEILWNPDSLAFKRADWQKTSLKQGAVLNAASIKMFESVQSVTYITYTSNSFFTKVGAPESGTAKISETVGEKTVFAINGGPSYAKIDGVVKNDAANTIGLGFTERGANGIVDVITNGDLTTYNSALAGTAVLLVDGVEQTIPSSTENDARMARSIYGTTKDGKYVMAVIDGGATGEADGATMAEAAFIARIMGLVNAVALSSGDESSLWVEKDGTVTNPSGAAGENAVANYIYVEAIEMFAGGDGSKGDPYQISNKEELNNMHSAAELEKEVYFVLTSDIDMTGIEWEPLNYDNNFLRTIHFDGAGYTISNFYCSFKNYPSFFGVLNGSCKNVKFENAKVESAESTTSGIIGAYIGTTAIKDALVENCHVHGEVLQKVGTKNRGFAGIGGMVYGSTIKNCYADVNVSSPVSVNVNGGVAAIAGELIGSNIENCFVTGKIDAVQFNVGGVVGRANTSGPCSVKGCISWMSSILGRAAAGKIVGRWNTKNIGADSVHENNYSLEGSEMTTFDNKGKPYADDFLYGNGENGGGQDYCIMGTPTVNATEAAKAIGWSTDVWDLSGETPQLKLFK